MSGPLIEMRHGHVLTMLQAMPAESVHCVVTSPPYWGLRDYGVPQVWDGDPACEHEWGQESRRRSSSGGLASTTIGHGKGQSTSVGSLFEASQSAFYAFCLCGASLGSLGLEPTPELYVEHLVAVFREVRRVLRDDGTLWLNLGDSYHSGNRGRYNRARAGAKKNLGGTASDFHWAPNRMSQTGLKDKDLVGVPWRVAFALQADGWWLRSDIVWAKPNQMPESVTDRPTKAHEYVFLLSKSARYYYDSAAVREPDAGTDHPRRGGQPSLEPSGGNGSGRNPRSVWMIATQPYSGAHFATFPENLARRCILAGTSERGVCRFCGAPWERMTRRQGGSIGSGWHDHSDDSVVGQRVADNDLTHGRNGHEPYRVFTVGWRPNCCCRGQRGLTTPATVLDPFCGTGTTLLAAQNLGRSAVGIELNPQYVALAEKRLAQRAIV